MHHSITRITRLTWTTYDLLITAGVSIAIGVTLSILLSVAINNSTIVIGNTTYEVVIDNFLGYEELMVVKRLSHADHIDINIDPAASLLETDSQGRYNGVVE
jgi:hypothetical protein